MRQYQANLRDGPGKSHHKTWTVGKYMPFRQLDRKGSWLKVEDVDHQIHWIYKTLVSRAIACVVVKVPFAYLRTGPGKKFAKAGIEIADKYAPFKKIDHRGNWLQVEDDYGRKSWIYAKSVWQPIRIQRFEF